VSVRCRRQVKSVQVSPGDWTGLAAACDLPCSFGCVLIVFVNAPRQCNRRRRVAPYSCLLGSVENTGGSATRRGERGSERRGPTREDKGWGSTGGGDVAGPPPQKGKGLPAVSVRTEVGRLSSAVRARVQVAMRARSSRAFAGPVWLTAALSARACSCCAFLCPPPPLRPPVLYCGSSQWWGIRRVGIRRVCGSCASSNAAAGAWGVCGGVNNPFYVLQPNP
jgi:hypothetical protein